MIPLTLSVSPNDLFLPQLTNILLTRSCCHTPRSFYSKSCLLLFGWTVNRLFNCSMLQKQPLKNLTNFLSEIGSSGVVSSLQNCFNVPKHFTDFWMVTWKHSFSVHQTHQEDRPDKNTTDSFCFNEFLFNDKKPWMDVGDIHQTMPLLFRLRDKNASLTQL